MSECIPERHFNQTKKFNTWKVLQRKTAQEQFRIGNKNFSWSKTEENEVKF